MNAIRGIFDVEVVGEKRTVVCDMQAAEALFQSVGPHWLLWLDERFLGKPDKLADGTKIRRMEPLSPRDLILALHGMLASDRLESGRTETFEGLFKSVSPFAFQELQKEMSKAVLASVGVPGEVLEAGPVAAALPPGNGLAATPGTGGAS
jgi:hypothetical protein